MPAQRPRGVTNKVTCEGCGLTGNPTQVTFFQMHTGWHRVHPKGSTMVAKRAEQRFACRPCVEAFARTGESWQQLSLLTPEQDQALHDDLAEIAKARRRGEAEARNVVLP